MRTGLRFSQVDYTLSLPAFAIGSAVRSIPEFVSGSYPIGFDTVTYYIPLTIAQIAFKATIFDYLRGTILYYSISGFISLLIGDAVLSMKILPVLIHGFLGAATYVLCRLVLSFNRLGSLSTVALVSGYFVTLRISWDLHRNMLGIVALLFFLVSSSDVSRLKRAVVAAVLGTLAVLAHELSGAVLSVTALGSVIREIINPTKGVRSLIVYTPGLSLFLIQRLGSGQPFGVDLSESFFDIVGYNLWFLVFCFGLVIPLSFLGVFKMDMLELRLWLIASIVLGILPLAGPTHRWILMSSPVLLMAFAKGIAVLNRRLTGTGSKIVYKGTALLLLLTVSWLSSTYAADGYGGISIGYFSEYNRFPSIFPTSMIENTLPIHVAGDAIALVEWVDSNLPPYSVVIVPFQLYGWAVITASKKAGVSYNLPHNRSNLDLLLEGFSFKSRVRYLYNPDLDMYARGVSRLIASKLAPASFGSYVIFLTWWSRDFRGAPEPDPGVNFVQVYSERSLALYSQRVI